MWKVIIVVCALGMPCTVMQEDPVIYYTDKGHCMQVAQEKHANIVESFGIYGYTVENSDYACEKVIE